MKAVNLIPPDAAKGQRARIAMSAGGIGAYVVLAVLAVAVVMASGWALSNKQLSDERAELARVEAEAEAAEAKSRSLGPYAKFADMSKARVETVSGLLEGRFDWAHSLREIARVVPDDVQLTSIVGTVSPDSKVEGGGGAGATLRAALPVPAVDLIGCARSQGHVARLLARLRAIDGVQRVSLASSEKSDAASASDTDCRSSEKVPQFQLTVFYEPQEGIVPAADAQAPASANTAATSAPTTDSSGGGK